MDNYKASADTSENYETMENMICDLNLSGLDVLRYFTDWNGLQLMTEDFIQNIIDCEL